jgi:hypothetical protein
VPARRISLPAAPEPHAVGPRLAGGAQLAATMMAASLVQFAVGALAPLILTDLELSPAALGVLLNGYYLMAALTSPGFGGLTGSMGGRRGLKLVVRGQTAAPRSRLSTPSTTGPGWAR